MSDEHPLSGGNSTPVARVGHQVLRAAGPWSPTVQAWMAHLRAAGVAEVPRPLGFAPDGREAVAFVEGEVPRYPLLPGQRTDEVLVQAAALLRRIHDAGRDFPRAGAVWQQPARVPEETVLVNDFAPHNLVLREGRVVGVIDLDQAAPGPAARDVAHLAYRAVPLTAPGNADAWASTIEERRRRIRLIADEYGIEVAAVLAHVEEVLAALAVHAGALTAHRGPLPKHVRIYEGDLAWFRSARADLLR